MGFCPASPRSRGPVSSFLLAAALAGFSLASDPIEGCAQVSRADSAAVLLRAAGDFERGGDPEVAAALYQYVVEHFRGTAAAQDAAAWLASPTADRADRQSRVELPVFGTLYGLWLGVAVPAALGADSEEAYGAGLLIGGPAGLFIARAAQRSRSFSEGQARAISWGGVFGTWQGGAWTGVLDIGNEEVCDAYGCYDTGDDAQEIMTGLIVGGLAGITTGALIARNPVGSGTSSAAQGGSIWGAVYGAMVAEIADASPDGGLVTTLITSDLGLLAGIGLARKYDLTRPRIRMINLGALVGGLGGLGMDLLIGAEDNGAIVLPLVTSVTGLVIAAVATKPKVGEMGFPDAEPDFSGAMFSYRNGETRFDLPMPTPTLLPFDDANGRPAWRPGLRLELFRARF